MGDGLTSAMFEGYLDEVHRVLQNLYDPLALRGTPLLAVFDLQKCGTPILALRRILTEAIQALRPSEDTPTHSTAWRVYHVLTYRYVEQSAQRTVANNMGLSERQLRRQEREAVQALADYLWSRYSLQSQVESVFGAEVASDQPEANGNAKLRGRERELEWARDSFPSEVTEVEALIQATLRTVDPLIRSLEVQVSCEIPDDLPPVTGQRMLLRQAFLSLLTGAVHAAPGGQVRVLVERQAESILVCLEATKDGLPITGVSSPEHLQMARQCIDLFGGELIVKTGDDGEPCCVTALRLPITELMPVLVIDDNVDTLNLFQRYLSGTRYQLVGVADPAEVLTLAQTVDPHAVILDVMLPGVDGWELLGRLREHPATSRLPVIVCTVMPQEQLALALGAAAYLRKPVSREALLSALDLQVSSRRKGSD